MYHIAVDGFAGATGTIELVALDATPPANDNFANAANLGSVERATATLRNAGATAEAGESTHAGQPPDASVWWQWTAPYNGEVQLDTVGSSVDTLFGVYVGTALNALTLVTENDDGLGLGGKSTVTFAATAGTTYRLAVDGFAGAEGAIVLHLAFTPTGSAAAVAYATWAGAVFPAAAPVAARGLAADPDGDGVANGIEYLMALDPGAANGSHLTIRRTGTATILRYLRAAAVPLGFEVLEGAVMPAPAAGVAPASPPPGFAPLATWAARTVDEMSTTLIPGEPGQAAMVEITVPDTAGFRFFSLRVGNAP